MRAKKRAFQKLFVSAFSSNAETTIEKRLDTKFAALIRIEELVGRKRWMNERDGLGVVEKSLAF